MVNVTAAGNIVDTSGATVSGTTVNLGIAAASANGAIGTVANPVLTATGSLSAVGKGTGDVQVQNTGDVAITSATTGSGNVAVTVKTGGISKVVATSTSGTASVTADNDIAAIAGSTIAGSTATVTAGKAVNFALGSITGTTAISVTAQGGDASVPTLSSGTVGVSATGGNANAPASPAPSRPRWARLPATRSSEPSAPPTVLVTALQNAGVATATGAGITVTGGSANVGSATGTTSVAVTANSGDATIGSLSGPTVTVGAGHDIVASGSPNVSGGTATLTAGHEIGTDLAPINSAVSSLSASLSTTSGAGIFITNTKATGLTVTGIDSTHATPAAGAPFT